MFTVGIILLITNFPFVYAENSGELSDGDGHSEKKEVGRKLELEQFHSLAKNLESMIGQLPEIGKGCKNCGGNVQNVQNRDDEFSDGILVFVSFSMPEASLIELSASAEKYNAKLIIRGVYKNSFEDMKDKILKINHEGLNLNIDPRLFKEYAIKRVPTFIKISNGKEVNRLSGNVSLEFAYQKLVEDR